MEHPQWVGPQHASRVARQRNTFALLHTLSLLRFIRLGQALAEAGQPAGCRLQSPR